MVEKQKNTAEVTKINFLLDLRFTKTKERKREREEKEKTVYRSESVEINFFTLTSSNGSSDPDIR